VVSRTIRVLLVDDEARLRQMAKRLLVSQTEIQVVGEADNGRTAVDLNSRLDPDLIVMDIAMPELNGLEATRIIRRQSAKTKIIVITAMAAEPYRRAAMNMGANAFLSKGALDSDLISTIHNIFSDDLTSASNNLPH
jgi:two-component system, NarL family, response regulator NreC